MDKERTAEEHFTKFPNKDVRNLRKDLIARFHDYKCMLCGYEYNELTRSVFDFHHMSDKTFEPTKMLARPGWEFMAAAPEFNKCAFLCANCHRLIHSKEAGELIMNEYNKEDGQA